MGWVMFKTVLFVVFIPLVILEQVVFLPYSIAVAVYKTVMSEGGIPFLLGYAEGYLEGTVQKVRDLIDGIANA